MNMHRQEIGTQSHKALTLLQKYDSQVVVFLLPLTLVSVNSA